MIIKRTYNTISWLHTVEDRSFFLLFYDRLRFGIGISLLMDELPSSECETSCENSSIVYRQILSSHPGLVNLDLDPSETSSDEEVISSS